MKKAIMATISIIGLILVFIPFIMGRYMISFMASILMFMALSQAWNVFSGFSGYVSFGHHVFFGIGAYTTFLLIIMWGLSPYLSFIFAGAITIIIAAIVGYPLLRVRGPYFSIATLCFAFVIQAIILNWADLTGGGSGLTISPAYTLSTYYYLVLGIAGAVLSLSYLIRRSPYGLRLLAIKSDEDAAENAGINTARVKTSAFMISSFFFALIGGVWAWNQTAIDPATVFDLNMQVLVIVITVFGGIGTVIGPILGTIVFMLLQEMLWINYPGVYMIILAIAIILVIRFVPDGIAGYLQKRTGRRIL